MTFDAALCPLLEVAERASLCPTSVNGPRYRGRDRATQTVHDVRYVRIPPGVQHRDAGNRVKALAHLPAHQHLSRVDDIYLVETPLSRYIVLICEISRESLGDALSEGRCIDAFMFLAAVEAVSLALQHLQRFAPSTPHANISPYAVLRNASGVWQLGDYSLLPSNNADGDSAPAESDAVSARSIFLSLLQTSKVVSSEAHTLASLYDAVRDAFTPLIPPTRSLSPQVVADLARSPSLRESATREINTPSSKPLVAAAAPPTLARHTVATVPSNSYVVLHSRSASRSPPRPQNDKPLPPPPSAAAPTVVIEEVEASDGDSSVSTASTCSEDRIAEKHFQSLNNTVRIREVTLQEHQSRTPNPPPRVVVVHETPPAPPREATPPFPEESSVSIVPEHESVVRVRDHSAPLVSLTNEEVQYAESVMRYRAMLVEAEEAKMHVRQGQSKDASCCTMM